MIEINEPWSLTRAWESIIRRIFADGEESSPRGKKTKELMHVDVHFDRPGEYVFFNDVRNVNPVMHIAELMYFLNGREDDVLATTWLKGMEKYLNQETRLFDGGYGPSLARGLPHVLYELQRDKDSRRAVIPILRPDHVVRMSHTDDYPCNPLIGFNLRHGDLNMWVVTRSQDMMQGYIYDQLEWRMLQAMMSQALDVQVGSFDHHIVSCHLYETDFEKAIASLDRSVSVNYAPKFPFHDVRGFWKYVRQANVLVDDPKASWPNSWGSGPDDARLALGLYKPPKEWQKYRDDDGVIRSPLYGWSPPGPYCSWLVRWVDRNSKDLPGLNTAPSPDPNRSE